MVTQEIGDTWIYGVPSDPIKVARYREVARLRKEWLEEGKFRVGDSVDRALLRRLALCAEHTWGVDTKGLKDYQHYKPKDLQEARHLPNSGWRKQAGPRSERISMTPLPVSRIASPGGPRSTARA